MTVGSKNKMENLKYFIKYPRRAIKEYLNQKRNNICLIMTLLVKDEEDILETNIRYHKAMGIDGFIVTSHNSTDRTNEILERLKEEGLVLDIVYATVPEYKQQMFVENMINIAKKKYKADWIINADADEFYYSKDLDLKKSILRYKDTNVNVLKVNSNFSYPDDRDDFLNCKYFEKRRFLPFEAEIAGLKNQNPILWKYANPHGCTKVIHKTKGFKSIFIGNHDINMKNKVEIFPLEIELYHYHVRNYKELENKVKRWVDSIYTSGKSGRTYEIFCQQI